MNQLFKKTRITIELDSDHYGLDHTGMSKLIVQKLNEIKTSDPGDSLFTLHSFKIEDAG